MLWVVIVVVIMLLLGVRNVSGATYNEGLARAIAVSFGLDPRLVLAIIDKESSGNPDAENPNDPSYGLMGIEPFWVSHFFPAIVDQVAFLKDPSNNIRTGCQVISYFKSKGFVFPAQVDVYNVGETLWANGVRNPAYRSFIISAMAKH